jgi:hypothetical protein
MFKSRSKIQKLSDNDPFDTEIIPIHIVEDIISYLPHEDLLNVCLVSKHWNSTIGNSLTFKRNVAIKVHAWEKELDMKCIKTSSRSYERLYFINEKLSLRNTLENLENMEWKYVTLNVSKIKSQEHFVKIINTFNSVRELKVLNTNISRLSSKNNLVSSLENLESLVLSDVTLDVFQTLIVTYPVLKTLSMRYVVEDIASPKPLHSYIEQFLQLNPTIKNVEFNFTLTESFFKEPVSVPNLQLKRLNLGISHLNDKKKKNLKFFMESQSDCLETLKLVVSQHVANEYQDFRTAYLYNDSSDEDEYHVGHRSYAGSFGNDDHSAIIGSFWTSMKSLKNLIIRFLMKPSESRTEIELLENLSNNRTLTFLAIQFIDIDEIPLQTIMSLLMKCPSLKVIYVTKLNTNILKYCAKNLQHLNIIKCFSIVDDCLKDYETLKSSNYKNLNTFIHIQDKCLYG